MSDSGWHSGGTWVALGWHCHLARGTSISTRDPASGAIEPQSDYGLTRPELDIEILFFLWLFVGLVCFHSAPSHVEVCTHHTHGTTHHTHGTTI